MDSAVARQLEEILRAQEARLTRQEEFQSAMAAHLGNLTAQLQGLNTHLTPPAASSPAPPNPAVPPTPVTPPS